MTLSDEASRDPQRWPDRLLRVCLIATAVLMFMQSVLAGLFMGGMHWAFAAHRELATIAGVAVMVSIVAAILARRFGQAPRWPIAATIGMLALMSLQAFAGFRSLTALHVPLGVIVILLSVLFAGWSLRARVPHPARSAPRRPEGLPSERAGVLE
ncbi:hypothetical protein SAMN05428970_2287 [Agromyces sp. CF514]|uniref:hypothetical protein n=1 Tax=Agromyces sp. CF514 TaxID=1881031 RepID=UPI0008EFC141|nr:hypothetical protein [Agromyces sp. CF514]SFR77817.1 hypothetical protein SAMN05428970_2287 [Agromyces sp. CF514]